MRAPSRRLTRTLIVEDDEFVALAMTSLLGVEGVEVRIVDRGTLALPAVVEFRPELVIIDVGLPDMDGRVVCEEIRHTADIPILLVSGHAMPSRPQRDVEFLAKPFFFAELAEAIGRLGFALENSARESGIDV